MYNINDYSADFERALKNSIEKVFGAGTYSGCFFHHVQSLYKNLVDLGLRDAYRKQGGFQRYCRRMFHLACLPPEHIRKAWRDLNKETVFPTLSAAEGAALIRLRRYYVQYWILTVTPEAFSVFGTSDRTNNVLEATHRWTKKR